MQIPIIYENKLIGFFLIDHPPFSSSELSALIAISNQLSVAINNSQQFEKIQQLNQSLEDKVHDRTRELSKANDELQDAIAAAKDANLAKSKFLANMSHELRTPLNAIIGYSEMLVEEAKEREMDNSTVEDLCKICSSGKHLLSLINNVLDLAKIEAGKMDVYVERYDVVTMVADIEAMVLPLARKNDNQFCLDIAENIGQMQADETKVRQIIVNLISNACKFTQQGTVSLTADCFDKYGKSWIVFKVSDIGGMSAPQLIKGKLIVNNRKFLS